MKCAKKKEKICQYNLMYHKAHANSYKIDISEQIDRQIYWLDVKYGMKKVPKLSHEKCLEAIRKCRRFNDNDRFYH